MERRRFTEEERQILLTSWHDPKNRLEICASINRSEGSCSFEYYRMLRKRGTNPAEYRAQLLRQKDEVFVPELKGENSDLETRLVQLEESIHERDERFAIQMENLVFLIKQKELINISALFSENTSMKLEIDDLRQKLKEEQDNSQKLFKELDFYLNQFFGLTSVEKLTSLKDFLPRIKTVVDKYGMVVGLTKDGDLHPFLQAVSGN